MRYTHFFVYDTHAQTTHHFPFEKNHFEAVGFPVMKEMPLLEAHQVINALNAGQKHHDYVYWLG